MTWQDLELPGGPRDLVGYGPNPPRVKWLDNARVVVNLVLNYEEGAEYAVIAGDDRNDLKVTVFACAAALIRNPAVAEWMARAGHEPCSHGWRWSEFWTMTREQERDEIARAVADIQRMTGERPYGWNARHGPSVNTRELLVEAGGFLYDSKAALTQECNSGL